MLLSSAQPRNYGVMAMKQVKIGVGFGLWRLGMPPAETIARVAERAEDWGLDSFWLSDHLLAPSPELDVVATLSLLASRTSRMKLGPSVLLLNLRHPLMVAKSFASLDYLSGGRMVMAVGTGANLADYAACGIPLEGRGKRLDEGIEVLRKVWRERVASYHGRFFNFDNVTIEPRPAARTNNDFGTMDIWVGGRSDAALKRAARLADGFFASFQTPAGIRREHGEDSRLCRRLWTRQRAHRIGINPALPHLVVARARARGNASDAVGDGPRRGSLPRTHRLRLAR